MARAGCACSRYRIKVSGFFFFRKQVPKSGPDHWRRNILKMAGWGGGGGGGRSVGGGGKS